MPPPCGGTGELEHVINPDMPWNEEIRAAWARHERLAASPHTAEVMLPLLAEANAHAIFPTVRVPTLLLHHRDDPFIPPEKGQAVADYIADSEFVELPGRNVYHVVEPWRDSFDAIAEFLTGEQPAVADDRVLATVLFTDIVDSTRRAAEMGDRDWHALLDAHDAIVRSQLSRFRGREVNTSGDGFLAMFDGPQRAIRCAMTIRDAVHTLGIEIRAGLHTGECEVRGDDIGGIGVHIGARVSAMAGPDEVLVSSTLRDLVIGSGGSSSRTGGAHINSKVYPASGGCRRSPHDDMAGCPNGRTRIRRARAAIVRRTQAQDDRDAAGRRVAPPDLRYRGNVRQRRADLRLNAQRPQAPTSGAIPPGSLSTVRRWIRSRAPKRSGRARRRSRGEQSIPERSPTGPTAINSALTSPRWCSSTSTTPRRCSSSNGGRLSTACAALSANS